MKQMKRITRGVLDFVLLIPFVMVLSAVFGTGTGMANGVVSGKYPLFFLSMLLISAAVMVSFAVRRERVRFSAADALAALFCVWGLVVTHLHNGGVTHRPVILLLILCLYFFFRFILAQRRWGAFALVVFLILTGFAEAVWGMRQLYGFTPSQHHLFSTTGSFTNPGPYAGYLAIVFPPAFYYLLHDWRAIGRGFRLALAPFHIRWGISLLSFSTILTVLPATMSRAAWLAAVAGCAVAGLLYLSERKKKQFKTFMGGNRKKACLIILPVITALAVAGSIALYRLKKDSADGRALIWKTSLRVITKNPFGVGLGNFPGAYGAAQAAYFAGQTDVQNGAGALSPFPEGGTERERLVAGNPEYAFNEYLQVCAEFGIIPFLVFILMIACAVKRGIGGRRYAPVAALVSLLVFAGMSYPFSILPFLVCFALLAALCVTDGRKTGGGGTLLPAASLKQGALLLLLCIAANTALYNRRPLSDAYRGWNKTRILYHAGLYEKTAEGYGKIYPYLGHEIQFLFEYAQSLSRSGDYPGSNRILEKAVRISCDPMLYNVMGKNHQGLSDYGPAEQCFTKAAMTVPNRLYPYYLLVKLHDEKGDGAKALETAAYLLSKEAKVGSEAVEEIRAEVESICQKYKNR